MTGQHAARCLRRSTGAHATHAMCCIKLLACLSPQTAAKERITHLEQLQTRLICDTPSGNLIVVMDSFKAVHDVKGRLVVRCYQLVQSLHGLW